MAQQDTPQQDDFLDRLVAAYQSSGRPARVQIDVTYRCELDCQHCYLDNRTTWPELTTAEWLAVLEQLAELGVWFVAWSGGEVTQRADLLELIQSAAKLGFRQVIRTHAGAITPAIAQGLAAAGVMEAKISVYSLRADVHDRFTRRPGSWVATMAGIACLKAAGVAVEIEFIVQPETIEEIPEFFGHFTRQGMVVKFGTSIYRDHLAREDLDLLNLSDVQRERAKALAYAAAKSIGNNMVPIHERPEEGPCGAGRTQFYISPDGAVWPCVMFPMELGHLREHRLVDIWENSPQLKGLQNWKNKDRDGCMTCAGSGMCFYCPGEAYKTTGDYKTPPAHFHTRTRAELRGYEQARGAKLTAEDWASIPDGGSHPPRPGKFIFPIYRPQKGRGVRVGDVE